RNVTGVQTCALPIWQQAVQTQKIIPRQKEDGSAQTKTKQQPETTGKNIRRTSVIQKKGLRGAAPCIFAWRRLFFVFPAPVRKTAAGNSHCRPPFERRRPGTVIGGPRSKDRGREQSLPAPVRKTAAGNSHWRPPFEIPRPGTVIAGPRSKDRGREQSLAAPVRKTAAGNSHWRPPFKRPRPGTII